MVDRLEPSAGWGVLHLFCRISGEPMPAGPSGDTAHAARPSGPDRNSAIQAVKRAEADGLQVVPVSVLGHKADVGFMALGPDLWRLRRFQTDVQGAGLAVVDSYVSLTEVSEYASGMPDDMKEARLHPSLPPEGMSAFCFYPMSKRRGEGDGANWYSLPFDTRKELMYGHGSIGRSFRGRVLQLITGSTGIDDWEWGVTLFGVHPDDLKDCVYTMRFDEASSRFAEFGPFVTGMVAPIETVLSEALSDA